MSEVYEKWANGFKRLRDFVPPVETAINQVLTYYSQAISVGESDQALRNGWSHPLGYRKKSEDGLDRGEQKIERLLFARSLIQIVREKCKPLSLEVTDQNFPLAGQSKGQVLCDALGFIQHRSGYHPVVIEVKATNANPWFAVVENLIQIRLTRFNLNNIEQHVVKYSLRNKNLQRARGAWGLVVAPSKYFNQNRPHFEAALNLIQELKSKTEARIILASTDQLKEGRLKWIQNSYWPF
jgi:hypothetical protein